MYLGREGQQFILVPSIALWHAKVSTLDIRKLTSDRDLPLIAATLGLLLLELKVRQYKDDFTKVN